MKKTLLFAGACLLASLAGGALSAYCIGQTTSAPAMEQGSADSTAPALTSSLPAAGTHFTSYQQGNYPDLTYAAENAVKAVVNIEATQRVEAQTDPFYQFFFGPQGGFRGGEPQPREQRAGGSGVIISADGYIVTNNHVIEGATKLRVKLNDGRTFDAKTIGRDPATDIALIKIEATDLPTLPFGSSDALRLGEWVLAIGSPFDLQSTITAGIVSAKARQLDVIPENFRIEAFIQTDAAVNPGNSGGALVNTRGELVGINTVIKSSTGSYIGYSFAVPESIVRKIVVDLREYGVVQRAMLGISYSYVDQDFIDRAGKDTGISELGGAYVASVSENGAASEAGIRKGDVIISIDDEPINSPTALSELINKHRPNDKVKLSVKRGDSVKHFEAVLRNKAGKAELLSKDDVDAVEVLGGRFADASDKLLKHLDLRGGAQVVEVKAGGLLERARVRRGFVITHINDKVIRSAADLTALTDKIRSIDGVYPDGRTASYVIVE